MIEYLADIVKKDNINFTDALKVNYSEFIAERGISEELWLVSNLPYNVSTPLLLLFLQTPEIKYMTLMFLSSLRYISSYYEFISLLGTTHRIIYKNNIKPLQFCVS